MNCKNCGNSELAPDAKSCDKCGKAVEVAASEEVEVEKLKRKIKNSGGFIYGVGWLTIVLSIGVYIWSLLDKNFSESGLTASDLSGVFVTVVAASVFVVLGKRINGLLDKNIKTYLQVSLGLSLLLFILTIATGGRVGLLFFVFIAYLISALISINKLMKVEKFTSTLTIPKYKLDKNGWIIFIISALILFFITVGLDSGIRNTFNGGSAINTTRENNPIMQKEELIRQIVKELKRSAQLPLQIDAATTLVDITAEPTAIRYHYVFSGIDLTKLTNDALKNNLILKNCVNNDTKSVLNQGINLEYSYINKDTQQTFFVTLTQEDCLTK